MTSSAPRRERCPRCHRPLATCFCTWVQPVANRVDVLILQHPDESIAAKNTAGLLHQCLERSRLLQGETFETSALQAALFADEHQSFLLYPPLADYRSLGITPPPAAPRPSDFPLAKIRLVVLDATWRKSRKMLYLNPLLQELPLISLQSTPKSIYKIRKAHSENQLSTLEASCYALQQLEANSVDYKPVLEAMEAFVAQLARFIPSRSI